jgi:hypothetical protein
MSWLTSLVQQNEEFESPKSFWYWAGLVTISAIVKDQVWMDCWRYNLYPNIYVMLYAPSGLKKGAPISLAKDLVRLVNNTRIISGRSSIQGILKRLSTAQTIKGQKPLMKSTGFIVASEFSSSLVADPAALTIMTDLYDRNYNKDEWESLLKQEEFSLKDPTVSLLGGINESHFNDFIDRKNITGGFVARTFIISETKVSQLNSLIYRPKTLPDNTKLAEYLKQLVSLKGPFESLEKTEAGEIYDTWYHAFYNRINDEGIDDPTGTIRRVGDSVKKVAMLLSLADSPELVIESTHIEEAINLGQSLIGTALQSTLGKQVKENQDTSRKALLLNELIERPNHEISRLDLLRNFWMHGNSDEWGIAITSLDEGELIKGEQRGNKMYYKMTDDIVNYLRSKQ